MLFQCFLNLSLSSNCVVIKDHPIPAYVEGQFIDGSIGKKDGWFFQSMGVPEFVINIRIYRRDLSNNHVGRENAIPDILKNYPGTKNVVGPNGSKSRFFAHWPNDIAVKSIVWLTELHNCKHAGNGGGKARADSAHVRT